MQKIAAKMPEDTKNHHLRALLKLQFKRSTQTWTKKCNWNKFWNVSVNREKKTENLSEGQLLKKEIKSKWNFLNLSLQNRSTKMIVDSHTHARVDMNESMDGSLNGDNEKSVKKKEINERKTTKPKWPKHNFEI